MKEDDTRTTKALKVKLKRFGCFFVGLSTLSKPAESSQSVHCSILCSRSCTWGALQKIVEIKNAIDKGIFF